MRNLIPLLILFACNSFGVAEERASKPAKTDTPASIISLHELLEKRSEFKGKKVTIAAYFVSRPLHRPWICAENGDSRKRLETTLSIKNAGAAKLKVLDSTRDRVAKEFGFDKGDKQSPDKVFGTSKLYHSQFREGTQALITGTFEVGDYSYPNGLDLKDHPFIELIEIQEVKSDDPRWKAAQTKGEQDSTVQPAIRHESKSEGSEKPQPEAEGRSR